MKLSVLLFGLLGSFGLFANPASEQLQVNMGGKVPALLIPATTYSCMEIASGNLNEEGSIKKNYFRLPSPDFKWTGDKESSVTIEMIRFSMNSSLVGGQYECIHAGTQLGSLFYRTTVDASGKVYSDFWNRMLGLGSHQSTSEIVSSGFKKCDLICGGVNFSPNSGKFNIEGQWEIYGIERKYSTSKELIEENPIIKKGNFILTKVWE